MKKYNELLIRIANEFSIYRGKSEDLDQWKSRLVYSVLGRMALASLYDLVEENSSSIVHMKSRIESLLDSYKIMYPELKWLLSVDKEKLSAEIYDIYLHTGVIYHEPNRIMMSASSESVSQKIMFTRGYSFERKQMISGLGTYMTLDKDYSEEGLSSMFQLQTMTLSELWSYCLKNAQWTEFLNEEIKEYLRMKSPFNQGYWVDRPDKSGNVSMMRTGFKGARLYYLYKIEAGKLLVSQLPQWRVEEYNYRSLANACLFTMGVLPKSTYKCDGDIVYLNFGYLPPPAELYLWKLYSWPQSMYSLPRDFNRILAKPVFDSIKAVIQKQGYEFIEEI